MKKSQLLNRTVKTNLFLVMMQAPFRAWMLSVLAEEYHYHTIRFPVVTHRVCQEHFLFTQKPHLFCQLLVREKTCPPPQQHSMGQPPAVRRRPALPAPQPSRPVWHSSDTRSPTDLCSFSSAQHARTSSPAGTHSRSICPSARLKKAATPAAPAANPSQH